MARTKATVRRMPITMPARTGSKNILNRRLRVMPFKIKKNIARNERSVS